VQLNSHLRSQLALAERLAPIADAYAKLAEGYLKSLEAEAQLSAAINARREREMAERLPQIIVLLVPVGSR
jgi:hypothetical protein